MTGDRPYRRAGAVIVAGALVWELGVSPLSRVYLTGDAAQRLRMLEGGRRIWVAGQLLTAAGTAAVPFGVAGFAQALGPGPAKRLAAAAAAALLAGAPLFIAAVADRASDLERFAYRRGPSWPFLGYSYLQCVALAALGAALMKTGAKRWVGLTALASAPVFGTVLASSKDIPPFVFYLVEQAAGLYLFFYREPATCARPQKSPRGLPDE